MSVAIQLKPFQCAGLVFTGAVYQMGNTAYEHIGVLRSDMSTIITADGATYPRSDVVWIATITTRNGRVIEAIQHDPLFEVAELENINRPYKWIVASEAERLAIVAEAADINKVCLQLSDKTLWRLTGVQPYTWEPEHTHDPADIGSEQIVTNVAALRTIPPNISRLVRTRGYYSDGDGGGGQYFPKVGAAPGTYVHNGGSVIVPNGGDGSAAWLLDSNVIFNPDQFGAKGDGLTDSTSAFNDLTAAAQGKEINLNGKVYYIADENLIMDVADIKFTGPGKLKFGNVLGESTNTVPSNCPKFTGCKFYNVTFSAPNAAGYAIFSSGSDDLLFEDCVISDVKPHFLQGVETTIVFERCKFVAPDTPDGTCLQTIGNVVSGFWVHNCEWEFAPDQGAGVLVSATNDNRLIGYYWITNNKVFTKNASGHCIDTFVDIEPATTGPLSSVTITGNKIFNAKIWVGTTDHAIIKGNYIRMTTHCQGAASGFPITIGNAHGSAGGDRYEITNNTVICEDLAIEQNKCPIGFATHTGRINSLIIRGNRLQANGKLINTSPASVISLNGQDRGAIVVEGNVLSYSSVPSTTFPAINLITQTTTTDQLIVRGNVVQGPPASYTNLVRVQNGGSTTNIKLVEIVDNDVSGCGPSSTLLSNVNTVTRLLVGDNPGHYFPDFTGVSFTNSWGDRNLTYYNPAGYAFLRGKVKLRGVIGGGTIGQSAFTLPLELRPTKENIFLVYSEDSLGTPVTGRVIVKPDGAVLIANGSANLVALDDVEFSLN